MLVFFLGVDYLWFVVLMVCMFIFKDMMIYYVVFMGCLIMYFRNKKIVLDYKDVSK